MFLKGVRIHHKFIIPIKPIGQCVRHKHGGNHFIRLLPIFFCPLRPQKVLQTRILRIDFSCLRVIILIRIHVPQRNLISHFRPVPVLMEIVIIICVIYCCHVIAAFFQLAEITVYDLQLIDKEILHAVQPCLHGPPIPHMLQNIIDHKIKFFPAKPSFAPTAVSISGSLFSDQLLHIGYRTVSPAAGNPLLLLDARDRLLRYCRFFSAFFIHPFLGYLKVRCLSQQKILRHITQIFIHIKSTRKYMSHFQDHDGQ